MSKITEILKEKFAEYQIPVDIADSFLAKYRLFERGLLPEIELRDIPSDDCFKTLQAYCGYVQEKPNYLLIYKLLQIPFSKIQDVREKLLVFMEVSDVEDAFKKTDFYFVESEFIDELIIFFKSKNISEYSKWFIEPLVLGQNAIDRVNGVYKLLDDCTAKDIVSNATTIWYPYSDPIGLITYLLQQGLTNSQICKLLIDDPILIMIYREDGCRSIKYGHNNDCSLSKR